VLPVALARRTPLSPARVLVAETLNLALLRGYRTGGTVHVIINNQVGFTTAPENSRSSQYATDVAKMIQAPVFHVNGDDRRLPLGGAPRDGLPAGVQQGRRDRHACYRRRGHNEATTPR